MVKERKEILATVADIYGAQVFEMKDGNELMAAVEAHADDPEVECITWEKLESLIGMSDEEILESVKLIAKRW